MLQYDRGCHIEALQGGIDDNGGISGCRETGECRWVPINDEVINVNGNALIHTGGLIT